MLISREFIPRCPRAAGRIDSAVPAGGAGTNVIPRAIRDTEQPGVTGCCDFGESFG